MAADHVLIGKRLTAMYLAGDRRAIKFTCEGSEPIIAHCDGDCCSTTWIESIENPEAALGSPVLVAEEILMPNRGEMPDRAVVVYYGFRIDTAKGTCVIDYRNESNGYYGGSLAWPGEYFYGGVFKQNVSSEVWTRVGEEAVPVKAVVLEAFGEEEANNA